jgi:hypothetical protein
VHVGIVAAERFLGVGDERIQVRLGVLLDRRHVVHHLLGGAHVALAVRCRDGGGHVVHVIALISIGRKRHHHRLHLEVAQPGGQRQDVHLPAGVVHIVLALDVETRGREHVGQACAVGGAAPVPHVQRPGWIGRYEFDLHLLALSDTDPAVGVCLFEHLLHHGALDGGPQEQVDEAGAGNLCSIDNGRGRQRADKRLGDLARVALQRLGELQRQVAGEIAMLRRFRPLHRHREAGGIRGDVLQRAREQGGEVSLEVVDGRGRHGRPAYKGGIIASRVAPAGSQLERVDVE